MLTKINVHAFIGLGLVESMSLRSEREREKSMNQMSQCDSTIACYFYVIKQYYFYGIFIVFLSCIFHRKKSQPEKQQNCEQKRRQLGKQEKERKNINDCKLTIGNYKSHSKLFGQCLDIFVFFCVFILQFILFFLRVRFSRSLILCRFI